MNWSSENLTWIREPADYHIFEDKIEITTEPHTDLWQRTYYHFRNDNAPVLQTETDEKFFSFEVKTDFSDSHHRFDQCGIVLYLDSENWLKGSVEYENETFQHLGSVVTNHGYSDWATTEIPASVKSMWYRLSRREDDFCIECSDDGKTYRQMRVCHLHEAKEKIRFGIYACSPEESSFKAVFTHMKITECKWLAHDGQAPDEFWTILESHRKKYPLMEPADYGKLAYQSEFGPEHLITDKEKVYQFIVDEMKTIPADRRESFSETIGNGLCRFYPGKDEETDIAAPVLTKLFCLTAETHKGNRDGLEERLSLIEQLDIPGMKEWLDDYRKKGCPPVHHSQAYQEAYQPHYRLISEEYALYMPVLLRIQALMKNPASVIIAIDGRCGSGKTRLGDLITQIFPCNLFHTDDFYLPVSKRETDWEKAAGANMDFFRLKSEILEPVRAGLKILYRPYDCQNDCIIRTDEISPQHLNIVEGSYSQHPCLSEFYDLKIFMSCSKDVQKARLQNREGEYYEVFKDRWIPLEEQYIKQFDIEKQANCCVDTTNL